MYPTLSFAKILSLMKNRVKKIIPIASGKPWLSAHDHHLCWLGL